ncbi:hypothetical protein [Micromonospora sp. NPDC023814]|uniref:hypothetical protein n=1 Tax=Micromonospora sp. NPDC023814 TaxID=3154596 RepID=UPI0033E0C78E
MATTKAWVLHATEPGSELTRGQLTLEQIPVRRPEEGEVLVEPLVGCWEANMEHAISRHPVDVARQRGDDKIVLGTCGVVRVLAAGPGVRGLREGQECLWIPFGVIDRNGYAERICAYDAPGSPGLLCGRFVTEARLLVPLPEQGRHPIERWAPFARYFTAWDNWRVARRCWEAQVDDHWGEPPLVLGWGGGVVWAQLELARRDGFRTAMVSGRDTRLAAIAASGAAPIDRREFPDLDYDVAKASGDPDALDRHKDSKRRFVERVMELSGGQGVSIFLDNMGGGLHRVTLQSLARESVLATVGWKHGMRLSNLRAVECIGRHIHVHTHAWRFQDCARIRDVQESTGWLPEINEPVASFDAIPQLADAYSRDAFDSYFPLYEVVPR